MNKKTVLGILTAITTLGYGISASAELLASPASKAEAEAFELGAAFISSEIDLDADDLGDAELERQMISVYGAYGVTDTVDLYAGVVMIPETEGENTDGGDGFGWGGGVRGDLPFGDEVTFRGYAQFLYISEEYGEADRFNDEYEGNGWFVDLGILAMYEAADDVNIYGALELAPFDDFEIERKTDDRTWDAERDDLLTIRLGAKFDIEDLFLRGEVAFAGEKSFTLGAGMTF